MKYLKIIIIFLSIAMISGCARSCENIKRSYDTDNKYSVTHYSGGKEINKWEFEGLINSSEASDGYYFYYNNKLIEVSGDVLIEEID